MTLEEGDLILTGTPEGFATNYPLIHENQVLTP